MFIWILTRYPLIYRLLTSCCDILTAAIRGYDSLSEVSHVTVTIKTCTSCQISFGFLMLVSVTIQVLLMCNLFFDIRFLTQFKIFIMGASSAFRLALQSWLLLVGERLNGSKTMILVLQTQLFFYSRRVPIPIDDVVVLGWLRRVAWFSSH